MLSKVDGLSADSEPGAIKSEHDGAGKGEACGVCVAAEQRNEMLEEDLQQDQEGRQHESSPNELVARQPRCCHAACDST